RLGSGAVAVEGTACLAPAFWRTRLPGRSGGEDRERQRLSFLQQQANQTIKFVLQFVALLARDLSQAAETEEFLLLPLLFPLGKGLLVFPLGLPRRQGTLALDRGFGALVEMMALRPQSIGLDLQPAAPLRKAPLGLAVQGRKLATEFRDLLF